MPGRCSEPTKQNDEKALDCRDAILQLTESMAELYQNKFNDIATDYENRLALLEHLTNTYNNGISDIEERGYLASVKFYEALRETESQKIDMQRQQLADLTKAMSEALNSGLIAEGSEAWYGFQQSINEVKEAIQESETAMVQFANSIRETNWEHFDYLQEQIGNIAEEADFLIDLMDMYKLYTDNGQLTDLGMSTMGLHGQNYNIYMAQADKYAEELKKINADIANDPNNTKLLEHRQELLEAQRDSILAAENEKEAIVDMVREGIELELDALRELIDKYEDAMDSAKDLYDYQKRVKDQTSEISRLQKQLTAYQNDTSEENKARLQKLQVSLGDAQEELYETQYDRYISDTRKLLDAMYDEFSEILNKRLDDIDALIADMIDEINAASSTINDTLIAQSEKVGYDLTEAMQSIWSNDSGMASIMTKYGDSFTTQFTSINNVLNGIASRVEEMIKASNALAEKVVQSATPTTPTDTSVVPPVSSGPDNIQPDVSVPHIPTNGGTSTGSSGVGSSTGSSTGSSGSGMTYGTSPNGRALTKKDYYGVALAIWNGSHNGWGRGAERQRKLTEKGFKASTVQKIVDQMGVDGYVRKGNWKGKYQGITDLSEYRYDKFKRGGFIDYTGIAQVDGTPSEPEAVLNAKDTANFVALKDAMQDIANGDSALAALFGGSENILGELAKVSAPMVDAPATIGSITYEVNIPIDHVADYEDFMNQMRRDGKFEQMLQSMTMDRLVGKSKLVKNRYQW